MPDARIAFTGYACSNDEQDREQLTMLLERLSTEVRVQTGQELKIFLDAHDAAWQNWKERINEESNDEATAVTWLLVIITPSLFSCDVCRDQLYWFLDRERARGQKNLIWLVYYISAREMDDRLLRKRDEMV